MYLLLNEIDEDFPEFVVIHYIASSHNQYSSTHTTLYICIWSNMKIREIMAIWNLNYLRPQIWTTYAFFKRTILREVKQSSPKPNPTFNITIVSNY